MRFRLRAKVSDTIHKRNKQGKLMTDKPTITLADGSNYEIANLTDEMKELLAIWETAKLELSKANRTAAINNIAIQQLEEAITNSLSQPTEEVAVEQE